MKRFFSNLEPTTILYILAVLLLLASPFIAQIIQWVVSYFRGE